MDSRPNEKSTCEFSSELCLAGARRAATSPSARCRSGCSRLTPSNGTSTPSRRAVGRATDGEVEVGGAGGHGRLQQRDQHRIWIEHGASLRCLRSLVPSRALAYDDCDLCPVRASHSVRSSPWWSTASHVEPRSSSPDRRAGTVACASAPSIWFLSSVGWRFVASAESAIRISAPNRSCLSCQRRFFSASLRGISACRGAPRRTAC